MKKIFAIFVIVMFCGSAWPLMASEGWDFYGKAAVYTWYQNVQQGKAAAAPEPDSDLDLNMGLHYNALIGATVKKGNIGGGFEYEANVALSKLYGTYNFGGGEILIGQDYTPINFFYSNQVWGSDEDLLSWGQQYTSRQPMLQLTMNSFKIALISPSSANDDLGTGGDVDILIPKVELSYSLKADAFFIDIFGGAHTYSIKKAFGGTKDLNVTSGVIGFGGGMDMGPAYARADVYYAMNGKQFGLYEGAVGLRDAAGNDNSGAVDNGAIIDNNKQEVVDVMTLGFMGVVGFKASDKITLEAGAGMVRHEADQDNSNTDEAMAAYVNAVITIADGFIIVPEIGYIDGKEDSSKVDQGDLTYFGAKWEISF